MDKSNLLIAMAEQCRNMIQQAETTDRSLPASLQSKHLLWMCDKIEQHVEDWPVTKLHRWIGFVQGGMIANQVLDLAGAKAMFDEVKIALVLGAMTRISLIISIRTIRLSWKLVERDNRAESYPHSVGWNTDRLDVEFAVHAKVP